MPSNAETERWAVDTSVAVAFLDAGHSAHELCLAALRGRAAALSGHAAFESYSALTRLPEPNRVSVTDARRGLEAAFPESCWLPAEDQDSLIKRLSEIGIAGGAVFDALVGEAARVNGRILLTRDRRALPTYDLLGVGYQIVK
ncbi:MAG: type II toxin-antitoxin system VapC family toxin [Propionibacteriaceae bacterium]|jgi:predicted nucleic acid-binding protein|nr:type II toxin-antitoxin system VapC family toxin [Propionibacteriaceae bacterium]